MRMEGNQVSLPIDLNEFFDQGTTDVVMTRELVQSSDIDGERFVTGSAGMPKRIEIYDEANLSRQGTSEFGYEFRGRKQVIEFEYGDQSFPTRWTHMNRHTEPLPLGGE